MKQISSREEFVYWLDTFRADRANREPYWQNLDMDCFLEAMIYWVENRMGDIYEREGIAMPEQEAWQTLHNVLHMAAIYE